MVSGLPGAMMMKGGGAMTNGKSGTMNNHNARRVMATISIIVAIASAAYLSAQIKPYVTFVERALLTVGYAYGVGMLGVQLSTSSKKELVEKFRTFFFGK